MRIKMPFLVVLALWVFAPVRAQLTPTPFPELEPITIENAERLVQLPGELTSVNEGYDVSPDGQQVAVARPDGVYLYAMGRFETPAKVFAIEGADQVYGPQFSPDGEMLAVNVIYSLPATEVSSDLPGSEFKSTVQIWDIQSGTVKTELVGRLGLAGHPIFSPDGYYVAGKNSLSQTIKRPAEGYSELEIWNLDNSQTLCCPDGDLFGRYGIGSLAFSPDSLILFWSQVEPDFANGGYGIVNVWFFEYLPSTMSKGAYLGILATILSNRVDRSFTYLFPDPPFASDVHNIIFSPDSQWLAAIGDYSTIWAVKADEIHTTLPEGRQFSAFLPDDSVIAIDERQQQLYVTDLDQHESIMLLEHFDPAQQTILLNPDGTILALHKNGVVHFYGVTTESKSTL
jgi:WD40 repeat protein